jgi:hypothetical protein
MRPPVWKPPIELSRARAKSGKGHSQSQTVHISATGAS